MDRRHDRVDVDDAVLAPPIRLVMAMWAIIVGGIAAMAAFVMLVPAPTAVGVGVVVAGSALMWGVVFAVNRRLP